MPAAKRDAVLSYRVAIARNALDCGEDILDPVPVPIGVPVKGPLMRAVFLRGNHRLRFAFGACIQ